MPSGTVRLQAMSTPSAPRCDTVLCMTPPQLSLDWQWRKEPPSARLALRVSRIEDRPLAVGLFQLILHGELSLLAKDIVFPLGQTKLRVEFEPADQGGMSVSRWIGEHAVHEGGVLRFVVRRGLDGDEVTMLAAPSGSGETESTDSSA